MNQLKLNWIIITEKLINISYIRLTPHVLKSTHKYSKLNFYISSAMSRFYKGVCSFFDKIVPNSLQPLWNHPAGPKTIFFWAPLVKWNLVLASLADINRPIENISLRQNASIAITGLIWSKYSTVITPKNWSLFYVNMLVLLTAGYQVLRLMRHQINNPTGAKTFGKSK